ncbi:hypothetical protein HII13_002491 [Brettanomyces bruxellensis]|uniref:Class E vacuolar protein-sorting machinery protein HSE1 n=1 Tax=Dekkera bruxellensis TaxID=5007 RepID=A0A8H6BHB5_DEKBR|nr:uncharacterized protein BRETT_002484 [Brettanomyces bruxellensis]KAF6011397.1 hypothetical protein HII13_002491 [Brettanomyces bruxellensis]QOU22309.1 hypothetical protein BRETT_002484 [Brettanomyces bruxellensis]
MSYTNSELSQAIDKATSADLTDDDYGLLLDVVDKVKEDPNKNISETIDLVKTKLRSTNANIVLRTITLVDFLAENCGAMMKAEIAKRTFVDDYLLKIVHSREMHITVKYATIKEIYKLSKSFKGDDSLSIMGQTFRSLQSSYRYLCQQASEEVDGGSKPDLSGHTSEATKKEEEDLKKAIELSLQDAGNGGQETTSLHQSSDAPPAVPSSNVPSQNNPFVTKLPEPETPKPAKVKALYDLQTDDEDTLSFKQDDIITVVEKVNNDWIRGCLRGRMGIVPANYVEEVPQITTEELGKLQSELDDSYNIEMLLSKLMDLSTKLKTGQITNQEFEQYLITNGIPSKLEKLQQTKERLTNLLNVLKLKVSELESLKLNADSSTALYQQLLVQSHQGQQQLQPPPSGAYIPQLETQMSGLSLQPQSPYQTDYTKHEF